MGDRAIWHDGWKAVARHQRGDAYDADRWELYHAANDFSEVDNLAEQHPERLQMLKSLWQIEAARYDVLPLEDDTLKLYQAAVPQPRATYVFYPGMARLDRLSAPDIFTYDSRFVAEVELISASGQGVILAAGDSSCGYELLMQDGFLEFHYVYTRNVVFSGRASRATESGKHSAGVEIRKATETSGVVTFMLDGEAAGELVLDQMWPIYAANSGTRCGENHHAPISRRYRGPHPFSEKLSRVVVDVAMG